METLLTESIILTGKIIAVVSIPLLLFSLLVGYLSLLRNRIIDEIIDIIINIPIIFPPIGVGFLLVMLFSGNGWLGNFFGIDLVFSFSGIALAGFIAGIPFISRSVIAGIQDSVSIFCQTSYTLGRGKLETYLLIAVPLLKKNILQGYILSIGRILGEVGMTMMIGGNIPGKTSTISLEIYNSVMDGENSKAIYLSVMLFALSFIIFYFIRILVPRHT